MRKLDIYVAKEVLAPFLVGVCAFTSLFVGTEVLDLAEMVMKYGAPLSKAVLLLLCQIPQILVWTFPMASLFATLLSLSRLSSTSEIVAMRAGGLSFRRIIAPIIVIGLCVTGASFYLNEKLVPAANEYGNLLELEIRGQSLPTITRNVTLQKHSQGMMNWFLYAAQFDAEAQVMHDVTIVTLEKGHPVETTYAKRIVWDETGWFMEEGFTNKFNQDGQVVTMQFVGGRQPIDIGQKPKDIVRAQKSPEEMNIRELSNHIAILRGQGKDVTELLVDWHTKWSLPFSSLFFVLIGAPLGIQPHRSGTSIGFGLSIVVIFVYYVIMTAGAALAQGGYLPPWFGAWVPNFALALGAFIFMKRLSK